MNENNIIDGVDFTHKLKFLDLFKLSTRIFTAKPARTILTILGTSVGIATVVFLISLGYGLQYILLGKLVTSEDSLVSLDAYYSDSNIPITADEVATVNKIPEVQEVAKLSEFSGQVKSGSYSGFMLVQIADYNYFRLSGISPDIGYGFSLASGGAVVSAQALRLLNLPADKTTLGKEISLDVSYQETNQTTPTEIVSNNPVPIVGIISDESEQPLILVPPDAFNAQPSFYKEIFVKAKNINLVSTLKDELTALGYIVTARLDLVNQVTKIMNVITGVLGVFGVAALLVSAIGMFNTMIVGFLERIYEVGVMKSIGATDRDVRNLFLMESLIMGLMGGIVGVGMGYAGGRLFNLVFAIVAARLGGKAIDLFITPLWFVLLILVLSAFIGLVAGFWPARKAKYLSPKEAFMRK